MSEIKDKVLGLGFRINTPQLLEEIMGNDGMAILKIPMSELQRWLIKLSERAIKLDDPELNIIMLSLALYDGTPKELTDAIKVQFKRMEQEEREGDL